MLSTLHARENDPHDALEIAPDVVFSARADRPSPTLAPDALGPAADRQSHIGSSAAAPSLDATFRATAADNRHVLREPSQARAWARRALIGFLFAIGSAFAATGWQHYGDRATSVIADWMPPFALTSPAPANPPESASPPVLQAAVVTEVSSQATSPAPDAAAMPSSVSDQTPLIQSMAGDVATMRQQIEQLKVSIRCRARWQRQSKPGPTSRASVHGYHRRRCARPRQRQRENRVRYSQPRKPLRLRFRRHRLLHLPRRCRPRRHRKRPRSRTVSRWCGRRCRCAKAADFHLGEFTAK
jgi:hypothetical protein